MSDDRVSPANTWDYNKQNPGLTWGCPCGVTGHYDKVMGHRKGWRKRPKCDGRPFLVTDTNPPESLPDPADNETTIPAHLTDPEEIARWINERHGAPSGAEPDEWELPAIGESDGLPFDAFGDQSRKGGRGFYEGDLGEGDWRIRPPSGAPEVTQDKIAVSLPISIYTMYDWMRGEGWNQGDGSLSAFVTDMLLDHFHECIGLEIAVVHRKDVQVA